MVNPFTICLDNLNIYGLCHNAVIFLKKVTNGHWAQVQGIEEKQNKILEKKN